MAGRPCLGPDDPLPAPLDFLCGNGKHPAVAQTRFDFYKDASRPAGVWHYVTCAAHREQNHTNSTKKKRLAEEERQRVEEERQLAEEERERVREEERQRVEEEEDEQLEQELLAIKFEQAVKEANLKLQRDADVAQAVKDGEKKQRHSYRRQIGDDSATPSPPSSPRYKQEDDSTGNPGPLDPKLEATFIGLTLVQLPPGEIQLVSTGPVPVPPVEIQPVSTDLTVPAPAVGTPVVMTSVGGRSRKSGGGGYAQSVVSDESDRSDERRRDNFHKKRDYWAETRSKVFLFGNTTALVVGVFVVVILIVTSTLAGFFRTFPWLVATFLNWVGALAPICAGEIAHCPPCANKTCPHPCVGSSGGY